jgi:voltage-gated potassium channel
VTPGRPPHESASDPATARTSRKHRDETDQGRFQPLRKRLYRWLELGSAGDPQGRWVDRFLILLVLFAVLLVALETVPTLSEWDGVFEFLEFVIGAAFLVEYLTRLWIADLHPPLRHYTRAGARLRYALQPSALIDLLAVLPFLLALVFTAVDFKVLVFFRLARFFKLARYSPALRSLANAVFSERHAIGASLVIIFGVVMLAATGMYMIERNVQPDALGTIPSAVWWAMTTVTTVGYGDVVPVTPAGKLIGGLVMLLGYGLLALPVGIVATAFAREIHSRDFAVTWGMVARVPLFEDLRAAEIAEIAKLLRSQSVSRGNVVTRKGEPANCMYFIASGAVEAQVSDTRVRLDEGAFFGELAMLGDRRRAATVTALSDTQLLVLDAHDLQALMQRKPTVARNILDEVSRREDLLTDDLSEDEIAVSGEDLAQDGEGRAGDFTDREADSAPDLFRKTDETGRADRS